MRTKDILSTKFFICYLQQSNNVSNNDSRPFSAPSRQRQQNALSRSIPTAALMTEAAMNRAAAQPQGLTSWMNGIFRSQGIPKQVYWLYKWAEKWPREICNSPLVPFQIALLWFVMMNSSFGDVLGYIWRM